MDVVAFFSQQAWRSLVSAGIGAVITALVTKLRNRTKQLRYSTKVERLAIAAEDGIF